MFGEKIRELRKTMGLTQRQFAAKLGVSFAAVNRWEKGRNEPQPARLTRIRELLRRVWPCPNSSLVLIR